MAHQTVRHWDADLVPTASGRTLRPEPTCPVEAALSVISRRWSTLIIRELLHGPHTYSALKQALPQLSDKTLTERLALLVEAGVADRQVHRGFPQTVTYRLTPHGEALRPLMTELYRAGQVLLAGQTSSPGATQASTSR